MAGSPLASPSATREVLARHGIALKKSLGQHFLVDGNVVTRIMRLAAIPSGSVVLEVGPGIGTLTAALCEEARAVVAVERDETLLAPLSDLAQRCPGLRVVHADAVKVPLDALCADGLAPSLLVANLPYAVAATVVLRLFEEMVSLRSATVMVQSEVADRMAAKPGGKEYGAYTVKLRLLAAPAGRFAVPRTCFMPPPRVDSAVLRLERVERPEDPADLRAAAAAATAAFAQRRKTLRNSVLSATGWNGAALDAALAAASIDGRARAETLTPDDYVRLALALREHGLLP